MLTQPIMSGTDFPDTVARFYRPVSSLSYAVEEALFGLNPVAFHATDVLIHVAAALGVYGLAATIGLRNWAAALGAAAFALHPAMASVVPDLPRRHDSLVTAGVCGALVLAIRGTRTPSLPAMVGSLGLLACAELAKELGYVGPVLLLPTLLAAGISPWRQRRLLVGTVAAWSILSLVLFAWRFHVLGGLGGYLGAGSSFEGVDIRFNELLRTLLWPFRDRLETYPKAWFFEIGLALLVTGVPFLVARPPAAAVLALGGAWLLGVSIFQLLSQSTAPWHTYFAIAGIGLLIGGVLDVAFDAWLGHRASWLRAVTGVCAVAVAVYGAAVVRESVLLTPYPQWHAAAEVARAYLAAIRPCVDSAPAGPVALEEWPVTVDDGTDQYRLVQAGVFAPYSVGPAVYLMIPRPALTVLSVPSSVSLGALPRAIRATCAEQDGMWRVRAVYDR
jgi:hypothetical protein